MSTFHYDMIDQIEGAVKMPAMETFPTMIVAVSSGAIDGYVADRPGAVSATSANADLTYITFDEGQGFTVSPDDAQIAVGVKEVFELDEQTIDDRLLCNPGEGAAWLFAGDATHGVFGGGFMYTNRTSISLGVVAGIEACASTANATPVYQMLEDLKKHPAVAPLIKGAKVVEHSGHMVPEGGINIMPPLIGDGVMLAGDSAMMCINLGYMVLGMIYAIADDQMAGQLVVEAPDAGDTSKAGLQGYVDALEQSFVLKDLRQYKDEPAFMENFDRMFNGYPVMVRDIMNSMFVVDGSPVTPMKQNVMPIVKRMGIMNILKDVRGAMKAL